MAFNVTLTVRKRTRRLKSGERVKHTRFVLNYKEPRTGQRRQLFFSGRAEALTKRNELLASVETNTYSGAKKTHITVGAAVENWLENRRGEVKANTFRGLEDGARLIVKPLLIGATAREREHFTKSGIKPEGTKLVPLLGSIKINELNTADVRKWHKLIVAEVGQYSAKRAKQFLAGALRLAEEDLQIRACSMPLYLGKKAKAKKIILTTEQVGTLIAAARQDRERGLYYAFPFLAGTRPSEQLALLWDDVDFATGIIRICRMQERDGSITELTKTEAGTRELFAGPVLKAMLLEWRLICPRLNGELHRVFPGPGRLEKDGRKVGVGGPLQYQNFRSRVWAKAFKKLRLPYVSPHAARHQWISTIQASGSEPGLAAKLAGHKNPSITLSHYTHAVRGGDAAMEALEAAYALA